MDTNTVRAMRLAALTNSQIEDMDSDQSFVPASTRRAPEDTEHRRRLREARLTALQNPFIPEFEEEGMDSDQSFVPAAEASNERERLREARLAGLNSSDQALTESREAALENDAAERERRFNARDAHFPINPFGHKRKYKAPTMIRRNKLETPQKRHKAHEGGKRRTKRRQHSRSRRRLTCRCKCRC